MLLALIIAFPLAGWLILGVVGGRLPRRVIGILASGTVALAFVASVAASRHPAVSAGGLTAPWFSWISVGTLTVTAGLLMDRLSSLMALVVTGVGFLIHVYSIGYMADDRSYARYFAYLNLFIASMLLLVLGSNLLVLFVGWELVGLCSYLLIGFWFDRERAAEAGRKAFVVNRIGDAGFLLGILLLATSTGTLELGRIGSLASQMAPGVLTAVTLLLFVGATGKSAQVPLHVWLPDAMEGPTPVPALIHAATMVTAGVYMVARSHALFERSAVALDVVLWVGVITAVFAATIGLVQTDIKRVLAYSTVSQLGYMFAALGLGAYAAGIFHLVTHAFFKALLFLGAGSVIHGLHGDQDLRKMGGLSPRMVTTTITMTIGAAGLAGVPGLAGFFSKDEILAAAFFGRRAAWALLLAAPFMTAFSTFRLIFLAFFTGPRMSKDVAHHAHESPRVMTWPLIALAALTVVAGAAVGIPSEHGTPFARFLSPVLPVHEGEHGGAAGVMLLVLSVIVGAAGILLAWFMYMAAPVKAETIGQPRTVLVRLLLNAWYVDWLYDRAIVRPLYALSVFLARVFDLGVIDGLVNGLGRAVIWWSAGLRRLQTGYVVNYALTMLARAVILVAYFLAR